MKNRSVIFVVSSVIGVFAMIIMSIFAYNIINNNEELYDNNEELYDDDPIICKYNGINYRQGQSFPAEDGCNTCTCSEEGVACTEKACLE